MTEPAFEHVILTRINVRVPWMKVKPWDRKTLEYRLSFFFSHTLPSVESQTERNFRWLVFISPDTPPDLKEKIATAMQDRRFILEEIGLYDIDAVNAVIRRHFARAAPHVLNTRLDSDDALATGHVEILHRHAAAAAKRTVPCAFNFQQGISHLMAGRRAFLSRTKASAFTSLLEDKSTFRTGYDYDHRFIAQAMETVQIDELGWLQNIHAANSYSSAAFSGQREVSGRFVATRFRLKDDAGRNATFAIALYNVWARLYVVLYWMRSRWRRLRPARN